MKSRTFSSPYEKRKTGHAGQDVKQDMSWENRAFARANLFIFSNLPHNQRVGTCPLGDLVFLYLFCESLHLLANFLFLSPRHSQGLLLY